MNNLKLILKHTREKHTILRALKVSLVVGSILGIINHYPMFINAAYNSREIVQIIITYIVPFLVSLHGGAMHAAYEEAHNSKP